MFSFSRPFLMCWSKTVKGSRPFRPFLWRLMPFAAVLANLCRHPYLHLLLESFPLCTLTCAKGASIEEHQRRNLLTEADFGYHLDKPPICPKTFSTLFLLKGRQNLKKRGGDKSEHPSRSDLATFSSSPCNPPVEDTCKTGSSSPSAAEAQDHSRRLLQSGCSSFSSCWLLFWQVVSAFSPTFII